MSNEDVFTRVNRQYYRLTGAEKKIADYIMLRQQDCQFLSISEMAGQTGVAEATVSRFCRRLGYSGYNAFKLAMAAAAAGQPGTGLLSGEIRPQDSLADLCEKVRANHIEAIGQTMALLRAETLNAAVELLMGAERVLCMGQGGSMVLAEETAHLFSTVLPGFYAVSDSHMQAIRAATMGPGDAVFYFSYSGSTRDMMDVLRLARERGARSLVVTRFPNSSGASRADVVLECGSREGPLQLGSVAARMAQLYLVDVLFTEVCRRDLERIQANRRRVADALANKHI